MLSLDFEKKKPSCKFTLFECKSDSYSLYVLLIRLSVSCGDEKWSSAIKKCICFQVAASEKKQRWEHPFFPELFFFFQFYTQFQASPPHHYPPPHFLAEKGNWFKNISSALLKVWLQYNVPVGGFQIWDTKTISASCCLRVRFPFVWVCVCVCMSGAILLAKQNLSQPGSSSKVQELCDELSWRGKMQSRLLNE